MRLKRSLKTHFKTVSLVAIILLISISLGGCWNRREVQDINIVTAMGIDRSVVNGQPKFLVTILTTRPSPGGVTPTTGGAGGAGQSRAAVISSEGDTVYDAIRNLNLRFSREVFLSHILIVVFGDEMAREGIGEAVDFMNRDKDIRERTYIAVSEGLARDALQTQPDIESLTSFEAFKILTKNQELVSKTVSNDLFEVTYALLNPGIEVSAANMKMFVPPETSSPLRTGSDSSNSGDSSSTDKSKNGPGEAQAQSMTSAFSGAAVFLGDRMVGRMDEEETEGLKIIQSKASGGIITVAFNGSEKNTSWLYHGLETDVKPKVSEDGSIQFEITVKGKGELQEERNAAIQIDQEDIKRMEDLVNQEIERICLKSIQRAQFLGSDVFGFGDKLRRTEPGAWKQVKEQWGQVFPTIQVSVKSETRVESVGVMGEPIEVQ